MSLNRKQKAILNCWETKYCNLIISCCLILFFFLRIIVKYLALVLTMFMILHLIFLTTRKQTLGSCSVKKVFLSFYVGFWGILDRARLAEEKKFSQLQLLCWKRRDNGKIRYSVKNKSPCLEYWRVLNFNR